MMPSSLYASSGTQGSFLVAEVWSQGAMFTETPQATRFESLVRRASTRESTHVCEPLRSMLLVQQSGTPQLLFVIDARKARPVWRVLMSCWQTGTFFLPTHAPLAHLYGPRQPVQEMLDDRMLSKAVAGSVATAPGQITTKFRDARHRMGSSEARRLPHALQHVVHL